MPTLYITKGLPGSGKSTLAKKLVAESNGTLVRVNRDDLRKQHPKWKPNVFSSEVKKVVTAQRDELIKSNLLVGNDVISDDTNLSAKTYSHLEKIAKSLKADVLCFDFMDPESSYYVPLETCIKQDLMRADSVGKDVILKFWYSYAVNKVPQPEWHKELPDAWIIDIDGTLAHHEGVRGTYEEKYDLDIPDRTVVKLVKALSATFKIIILSGREGSMTGELQTKEWLKAHNIPYDEFYMRKVNDRRNDSIIKKEIFETKIKFRYNIVGVVDDRPRVIRMWEEQGLKVLKCGPGYEF